MSIKTKENNEKKRFFNRISELKCVYCGKNFKSLRSNSLYCGGTCKNYACRDRKKGIKVHSTPSGQINSLEVVKKPLEVKKNTNYKEQLKEITVEINKISIDFTKRYPKARKFYDKTKYETQWQLAHQKIQGLWKVQADIKKANRKPRIKKPKV